MGEPLTLSLMAELLPRLHAAFPRNLGKDNPTMMVEVYRNGLRGLTGDAVRAAVDHAIRDDQYFPKVARIRELAAQWERHNMPAVDQAAREVPWNVCPTCGARAESRTIRRRTRDPAQGYAVVRDEHGAEVWEEIQSTELYMDHDPIKHHITRETP